MFRLPPVHPGTCLAADPGALTARRLTPPLALRVPSYDSDRGGTLARPAPVAVCPPTADFSWMDIRAQAPARTSPPGGLEALIPRQRPKTRQRGHFPLYSSVCRQAVPMDQRGTLAPPAQVRS